MEVLSSINFNTWIVFVYCFLFSKFKFNKTYLMFESLNRAGLRINRLSLKSSRVSILTAFSYIDNSIGLIKRLMRLNIPIV